MTDEEHAALDLYLAFEVGPHHSHFTAELYRLIAKADFINRLKMTQVWPLHVRLYEEWMLTADRFDFYTKYNCQLNYKPEALSGDVSNQP